MEPSSALGHSCVVQSSQKTKAKLGQDAQRTMLATASDSQYPPGGPCSCKHSTLPINQVILIHSISTCAATTHHGAQDQEQQPNQDSSKSSAGQTKTMTHK